jgi:ankyrin repeat protein
MLLHNGADPNMAGRDGWGPLHFSSAYGRTATVKLLLAKGANPQDKADTLTM